MPPPLLKSQDLWTWIWPESCLQIYGPVISRNSYQLFNRIHHGMRNTRLPVGLVTVLNLSCVPCTPGCGGKVQKEPGADEDRNWFEGYTSAALSRQHVAHAASLPAWQRVTSGTLHPAAIQGSKLPS